MNKYMNTADFDFHLPEELIAQTPLEKRDASKLLIVNRETGEMQDKHFHSIIDMLEPGDALVMNDTRVLPARLYGQKEETRKLAVGSTWVRQGEADVVWIWFSKSISSNPIHYNTFQVWTLFF